MTSFDAPQGQPGPEGGRLDNGLRALAYVPLTDVDAQVGAHLLDVLGRARIPAYLSAQAGGERQRLFVASEERGDARSIVAATVRALGDAPAAGAPGAPGGSPEEPNAADPLAGLDTDAIFDALVADWHVDTHDAIREAERQLRREDADWRARLARQPAEDPEWLDDDHFVPPPPPPLPRLAAMTVFGVALIALSIAVLAFGSQFLPGTLPLVLGICGVLGGGAVLFTRLRDSYRDEDDDGSAV